MPCRALRSCRASWSGRERWQTGTASFAAIAGTGAALAYLDELGRDAVRAHQRALCVRFLDAGGVVQIGFVHYHGPDHVDRVLELLAALA